MLSRHWIFFSNKISQNSSEVGSDSTWGGEMGKRRGGGTPGVPASRSSPGLILKRIDYPTGGGTGLGWEAWLYPWLQGGLAGSVILGTCDLTSPRSLLFYKSGIMHRAAGSTKCEKAWCTESLSRCEVTIVGSVSTVCNHGARVRSCDTSYRGADRQERTLQVARW